VLTRLSVLASRISGAFNGRALDQDFDREVESHLAMMADDYRRRGMSEEEARRTARLRFGGPTQTREDQHDRRGLPLVETALQDVRYALRTLRRNPGFTFVVILTLAVGIGAVTSMFTVVRAVLLRPLPYTQPDRLIEISETNPLKGWTHTVAAPANVADWRARNTVFTDIAGYIGVDNRGASQMQRFLSVNGEPQPVNGIATTGNLFDVLGVRPLLGRTFTWSETFDGNDRVLVLSYGAWQSVFGGDPGIVGRAVVLSGRSMTVVGVMPRDFFFPNRSAQFWASMGVKPDVFVRMRRPHWLTTVARLRPGPTRTRRWASGSNRCTTSWRPTRARRSSCSSAPSRSCSSSSARTWRACSWDAAPAGCARSRSGARLAPAGRGSCGSC